MGGCFAGKQIGGGIAVTYVVRATRETEVFYGVLMGEHSALYAHKEVKIFKHIYVVIYTDCILCLPLVAQSWFLIKSYRKKSLTSISEL